MPPRERFSARALPWPTIVAVAFAALLTCGLAPNFARAQGAESAESFLPMRGHSRVLIETLDGRLVKAAPVGVFRDSLMLERPLARFRSIHFRIARTDVARAWVPQPRVLRMALVHGITGFAGGVLTELGLGSSRQGFGIDPKHVLGGGIVAGATSLPVGALIGLLWPAWRQVVPPPGEGANAAAEPYPDWSATALGGVARANDQLGTGTQVDGTIAGWKNMGPHSSWGFEYGTLSRGSTHFARAAYRDTMFYDHYVNAVDRVVQDRWAYSTLQFRHRFGRSGVRPSLNFGFGDYENSHPYNLTVTDSLGNQTHRNGRGTFDHLGANAGVGVTWGRGPAYPDIEVRVHYINPGTTLTWVTLQAGIAYQ